MAKVSFYYRGKSKSGNVTIKLKHKDFIDFRLSSPIQSEKRFWFKKKDNKTVRRLLIEFSNLGDEAKRLKNRLDGVHDELLKKFNEDYNNGIPITKEWFKESVDEIVDILDNKDKVDSAVLDKELKEFAAAEKKKEVYSRNLLTNAIDKVRTGKYADNQSENTKYRNLKNLIEKFEVEKFKKPVKIKDVNQSFIDQFYNWAIKKQDYEDSYTKILLKKIKHTIRYAYLNDENEIIEVSKKFALIKLPQTKHTKKNKIVITLDFDELNQIDNTLVPLHLDNAKKVILLSCETGLRYSDYGQLNDKNKVFESGEEYWEFFSQKTDSYVRIPATVRIKDLIERYGLYEINYKSDDVRLNKEIKEVCKLSGIDTPTIGIKQMSVEMNGKSVRRGVRGEYPKYELIGTHTMRRSFATNFYGKIRSDLIMEITGHSSLKQLLEYINKEKTNDIKETVEQFNKVNERRANISAPMKIVK